MSRKTRNVRISRTGRVVGIGLLMIGLAGPGRVAAQDELIRQAADLEVAPRDLDLAPGSFVVGQEKVFFAARGAQVGYEPWSSDGTAEGTDWIADLCPGPCTSQPSLLASDGQRLLLGIGQDLWISDGTDAGTSPIATPCPDCRFSSFLGAKWTGERFVVEVIGDFGRGLWSTDGTAAGTFRLDLQGNRLVSSLTPGRSTYFAATGSGGRTLLFATDGSQQGTRSIRQLCSGCSTGVHRAVELGSVTVFTSFTPEDGWQPWVTDGTADGTRMLANLTEPGMSVALGELVAVGDWVFGRLNGSCGQNCLWRSDGTAEGTRLAPELYPPETEGRTLIFLAAAGNTLYGSFLTPDGNDQGLWALAGPGGRHPLATGDLITFAGEVAGTLYFSVLNDGEGVTLATDGTPQSTRQIVDQQARRVAPVAAGALLQTQFVNSSDVTQSRLWWTDGSAEGTRPVAGFNGAVGSSNPERLRRWQDRLAFTTGQSMFSQQSLWATDGAGVQLLAQDRGLHQLRAAGENLYVYDFDLAMIRAFGPDGSENLIDLDSRFPHEAVPLGDRLVASVGGEGQQIWSVAPTQEQTELLVDVHPGWFFFCPILCEPQYFPRDLVPVADRVMFSAFADNEGPGQLWSTDGTSGGSTATAEFSGPGSPSGISDVPTDLTSVDDRVFFRAVDGDQGYHLWVADGTAEGTRRLTDLGTEPAGHSLFLLTPWNDRLAVVERREAGPRIWSTDGGALQIVATLEPGTEVQSMVGAGQRLYWTAYSPATGLELGYSDGTAEGTRILDLYPGPRGSGVGSLTPVDGGLFFAADSGNGTGFEPWFLASGSTWPLQLADLSPGREPSAPGVGEQVGHELYFAAADEVVGRELFALDLTRLETLSCPADRLCFFDRRFEVSLRWQTAGGASGDAQRAASGGDSGLFWFFDPGNWESMVKVLNGCAINGHYWVYAATSSDVGFTLEVEDTQSGQSRSWTHAPGQPAPAITEVQAFPCDSL